MLLFFFIILISLPLIFLFSLRSKPAELLLTFSLLFSILLFNYSLLFLINFDLTVLGYQFNTLTFSYLYIQDSEINNEEVSLLFNWIGVDSLSIWFLLLTTFLLPPSILYSWTFIKDNNIFTYLFLMYSLNFILIIFFLTTNILIFYIFFELGLLPVFLLILIWGSKSRKVLAAMYFFIYTFFGSIFFLFALFSIYSLTGSLDFNLILNYPYTLSFQLLFWPCLTIAMLVKIPMVPFHLWLPEAHVEAPTTGSVYLASVLLKLGSYGFLRLVLPIFPYATLYYTPLLQMLAIISIIYCSGIIIRQIDLKKIIAYSSIIHMNMAILALFTFNSIGIQGAILLMFGHGLTSGALFFLVGMLYDRYKTKLIFYYSGIATVMPIYAFLFLFFSLCNIGFPGTLNFSSELLIFIGVIEYGILSKTFFFIFFLSVGLFSSICYSMWLANKLLFGNIKEYSNFILCYAEITEREILVLTPFVFFVIFFGLNSFLLQFTYNYTKTLLSLFL